VTRIHTNLVGIALKVLGIAFDCEGSLQVDSDSDRVARDSVCLVAIARKSVGIYSKW
jgi:hypothetical protein